MSGEGISIRGRFALAALLYALAVVYASTVVGPTGLHFVPMDVGQAWHRFLQTPYLINGSDQRADWMANLLMLVPMGFLIGGALSSRRAAGLTAAGALFGFALCVAFLLAVKFLQLFFPGRTVSLNYMMAQSIGSALGVMAFWRLGRRIVPARSRVDAQRLMGRLLLVYAFAYLLFMLLPLNVTLSAGDLQERLKDVPRLLVSWPGAGRSAFVRLFLVMANFVAAIPLGLLLAIRVRRRPAAWYAAISLLAMSAITFLKIFVMSATPSLVGTVLTTVGMLLGVWLATGVGRRQAMTVRAALLRSLPVVVPLYVVAVLEVNGLLTLHWRSLAQAREALDPRGLIPFWNWYIVSKAQAAQSQVAHAIMFAPVGILLSLRRPARRDDAWAAAALALVFAFLVELGRAFLPGLAPDFYEAVTAAVAAGFAVPLTRLLWNVLEATDRAGGPEDAVTAASLKSNVG